MVRGCIQQLDRAVLTNGHTGHVARAPGLFFRFEGSPTGSGEIFLKLSYYLRKDQLQWKPGEYILAKGPVRLGVPRAPMQVKTLLPTDTQTDTQTTLHR